MGRKWHHSVTWSRSSGTPKQAFYSTPFTHRETSRLRRFSTLLWGLLQILRISPHRSELFLMVPPRSTVNSDMLVKCCSSELITNRCVKDVSESRENCYCWCYLEERERAARFHLLISWFMLPVSDYALLGIILWGWVDIYAFFMNEVEWMRHF